jgi:hypothetical protein
MLLLPSPVVLDCEPLIWLCESLAGAYDPPSPIFLPCQPINGGSPTCLMIRRFFLPTLAMFVLQISEQLIRAIWDLAPSSGNNGGNNSFLAVCKF